MSGQLHNDLHTCCIVRGVRGRMISTIIGSSILSASDLARK